MQSNIPINTGQVSWPVSAHAKSESRASERRCVTVHACGYICVCCERSPSAAAPSSLENQSFTWSKTHSRILTLYRFQEPLFTPAPEETPWKKEPQAAKKHTKQQGKTVPNLIKVKKSSRTTAHLFRECPQSRRVNKTQYLLDLWANNHYLLRVDEWRIILCKPHK